MHNNTNPYDYKTTNTQTLTQTQLDDITTYRHNATHNCTNALPHRSYHTMSGTGDKKQHTRCPHAKIPSVTFVNANEVYCAIYKTETTWQRLWPAHVRANDGCARSLTN
jgi:hypothetical protein